MQIMATINQLIRANPRWEEWGHWGGPNWYRGVVSGSTLFCPSDSFS